MKPARIVLLASLAALVPAGLASAQDRIIDAKPCSLFCKLRRNVMRDAAVSATAPLGGPVDTIERTPAAADGIGRPNPSAIFARRGEVMAETPSERARRRRMEARMARETADPPVRSAVPPAPTRTPAKPGQK